MPEEAQVARVDDCAPTGPQEVGGPEHKHVAASVYHGRGAPIVAARSPGLAWLATASSALDNGETPRGCLCFEVFAGRPRD